MTAVDELVRKLARYTTVLDIGVSLYQHYYILYLTTVFDIGVSMYQQSTLFKGVTGNV